MKKVVPEKSWLIPEHAKRVFKGVIFDVYQWDQEMFDGSVETFEMARRTDMVDTIAIKDGKFAVVREEQPGNPPFYDLPGGRHDRDNESYVETAQRELLEETGMKFSQWRLVSVHQYGPKVEAFFYIYLATDFVEQLEQNLDVGEKIKVEWVTLDEYFDLHSSGQLRGYPELFNTIRTINDLLALPEFVGKEIEVN